MTRYRTKVLTPDAFQPAVARYRGSATDSWSTWASWQVHTRYHVREMWDEVTPDFQKRKNRGDIVINPMTVREEDATAYPFHVYVGQGSNGAEYSDNGVGVVSMKWPLSSAVPAQLIDKAVTDAVTQARAKLAAPDFAGITAIAELRETLDLLKSPLVFLHRKTSRYVSAVKRARERHRRRAEWLARFEAREAERAARYLKRHRSMDGFEPRKPPEWVSRFSRNPDRDPQLVKTLASLWLTYRYGIMPLVYSVQDAMKAIDSAHRKVRQTARGQVSLSHSLVENPRLSADTSHGFRYGTDNVYSSEIVARAFVVGEFEATVNQRFGIRLSDVPLALWEGVTLSFVADWFFNVGEFLSALTSDLRASVLGSGVTVQVTTRFTSTSVLEALPGYRILGDQSGKVVYEGVSTYKTRYATSVLDIGLVTRIEMNAQRYADAFSLIFQRLTHKRV